MIVGAGKRGLQLCLSTILCAFLIGVAAAPAYGAPALWTTYHRTAGHSGVDPDPRLPLAPVSLWQTRRLDGAIYGEPLVFGSRVYVVTEGDSVYALNAATGGVAWRRHVGIPVPDYLGTAHGCGNIGAVGITSTPVIDSGRRRIFAVAATWDGHHLKSIQHRLVGFDLSSGRPVPGLPRLVNPPSGNRVYELQRPALALARGKVIIGYGGDVGDCGTYHGWLIAAPESGRGRLQSYEVARRAAGGSIWGGGEGPVVDPAGDLLVTTANGFRSFYDGQQSVLRLSPDLRLLDHWTPSNWPELDRKDLDFGSSQPLLLPGGLLFVIGKAGVGSILSLSHLGGTGAPALFQQHVCAAAFGGAVYFVGTIYVPCLDGLRALSVNTETRTFAPLPGWQVSAGAIGPPIVAAGLVWSAGWRNGNLYGLNPSTGANLFRKNLGSFAHFATPTAVAGRLFIANGGRVSAFQIAH